MPPISPLQRKWRCNVSKPMLASDFDESKLRFPLIIQPKIDGVRGLNLTGRLTGRSLKAHRNKHTTSFYSHSATLGLDGEFAAEHHCHPDLCRITSSALSTAEGDPYTLWWLFDYITPETRKLGYQERYNALVQRIRDIKDIAPHIWERLRIVLSYVVNNMDELLAYEEQWLNEGYEGVIIRDMNGMYKDGRSTVREMGLLRIKRFIEEEALVLEIVEGQTNGNDAQVNELGRQFRSSHQENMIPNGMVGSLTCKVLKDIFDPIIKDKLLLTKGQVITVSPGKMTNEEAADFFRNPFKIVGKVIKFKFFPKGIKDKPRFPTYMTIRAESDM